MTKALNLEQQAKLIELLNYMENGDFSTFEKILSLSEYPIRNQKYLAHNMFQACAISGLIEVLDTDVRLKWMFSGYDRINSNNSPFKISRNSLKDPEISNFQPIFFDNQSNPIIYGNLESLNAKTSSIAIFRTNFRKMLPQFSKMLDRVVSSENWREIDDFVEVYEPNNNRWVSKNFEGLENNSLIRMNKDYYGREYQLIFPKIKLRFKILSPEWSSLCAIKIFGWDWKNFIKIGENFLEYPAGIRIPNLFRKFLFSHSSKVELGPEIRFSGISSEIAYVIPNYFFGCNK